MSAGTIRGGLAPWSSLPEWMQTPQVREYYDILAKHKGELILKRVFDVLFSGILLVIVSPFMLIISLLIVIDSPGGVFYRQARITQYGHEFKIHKFRTMVANADKMGTLVTVNHDQRVTRIGKVLRGCRLDELPQLIDVFQGNMSFVGTRPEVAKYVEAYTDEMNATLLLPAGVTSEASYRYKDEAELLDAADDVDSTYIEQVLPGKMVYNLKAIREFSLMHELGTMFKTVLAIVGLV